MIGRYNLYSSFGHQSTNQQAKQPTIRAFRQTVPIGQNPFAGDDAILRSGHPFDAHRVVFVVPVTYATKNDVSAQSTFIVWRVHRDSGRDSRRCGSPLALPARFARALLTVAALRSCTSAARRKRFDGDLRPFTQCSAPSSTTTPFALVHAPFPPPRVWPHLVASRHFASEIMIPWPSAVANGHSRA